MNSDIISGTVTANGVAYSGRTRLKAVYLAHTNAGGNVVFRDGGVSGTVRLTMACPATADAQDICLPGNGILFENDIYVTVGPASSVTVFHA